jgi:hypothetical protein
MTRSLGLVLLALALASGRAQAAYGGYGAYGGFAGPQPALCLARVDDRGVVHIRQVNGITQAPQVVTMQKVNERGETVNVSVTFARQLINQQITTMPGNVVRLFDTAGKEQDAGRLADLLRSERPVLVVEGPPQVKFLQGFKKDLPVLSLPSSHPAGPTPQAEGPAKPVD